MVSAAPRKPQSSRKPKNNPAQLIMWLHMRHLRQFRLDQVQRKADCTYQAASRYINALRRAGYLEEIERVPKKKTDDGRGRSRSLFALVRDTGPQAPRLIKGSLEDPNLNPELQDPLTRCWQSLRMMRGTWMLTEIEEAAGLSRQQIKSYLRKLQRTGYVHRQGRAVAGSTSVALYRLVRNTGPLSPMFRQDGTAFDPNTGAETRPE